MPKQYHSIRDWSGGSNNRRDPRDIAQNENSFIQNMSIDALGKIKTSGGLFANLADSDGDTSTTPLTEYIVNRTAGIEGSGGYGLFYFESDHSSNNEHTIIETRSSTGLGIGTTVGKINFVRVYSSPDIPPQSPESPE